jgi:hypothetical protein
MNTTATKLYSQAMTERSRFGANAYMTVKCDDVMRMLEAGERPALRTFSIEIRCGSRTILDAVQAVDVHDASAHAWRDIEKQKLDVDSMRVADTSNDLAQLRNEIAERDRADHELRNQWQAERFDHYRDVVRLEKEIERLSGLLNPKPAPALFGPVEEIEIRAAIEADPPCSFEKPCVLCRMADKHGPYGPRQS